MTTKHSIFHAPTSATRTLTSLLLCCLLSLPMLHCSSQSSTQLPSAAACDHEQLRRDIGEMLLVGFRGLTADDTSHIIRDIRQHHIGGVLLFEYDAPSHSRPRNISSPTQLQHLCRQLQTADSTPLFIAIDQEGGRVNRLKSQYGFPPFASAKAMARGGADSVKHYARLTAHTLHTLGINLNFAPCVDVDVNPDCPIIGRIERSFSADAERVAQCAAWWIEAHHEEGVVCCLKHFPGHGSSLADTHLGLADVSDTWQEHELIPYRRLIAAGKADMVMTTHVYNALLDSLQPATLSRRTLTDLLRDSLGFDGVVITDDMAMGAMTQHYTLRDMLLGAIEAGADMLCLSNNGDQYDPDIVPHTIDLIVALVDEGRLAPQRIAQSAQRIRTLKETQLHPSR